MTDLVLFVVVPLFLDVLRDRDNRQPQPNNPGAAIVQILYDKIVTDVMGFSNVGIGLFGILKGRSTYIQTVFFDNNLWIESGVDQSNFGETYYNVYARDKDGEDDDDDDDWQK